MTGASACRSMRRTACTARPAILKTRRRILCGYRRRVAVGRIIRICEGCSFARGMGLHSTSAKKRPVPDPGLGTGTQVRLSSQQRFRSSADFALEIEVVDIRRIKRGWRSKHDFAALAHRAFAQLACVEAIASLPVIVPEAR